MTPEEYIQEAVSKIKSRKQKFLVQQEISDHIQDRIDYYVDAGYSREKAEQYAMERMGKPEEVAQSMANMYNAEGFKRASIILSALYGITAVSESIFVTVMLIAQALGDNDTDTVVYILSAIAFIIGAVAFVCGLKAKDSFALDVNSYLNFGIFFFSPIAFIPFGYAFVETLIEFPASLFSLFGNYDFGKAILEPLEHAGQLNVVLLAAVLSFAAMPLITGIIGRRAAKTIETDMTEKSEKRYRRYAVLLLIVAVIGMAPSVVMPCAEAVAIKKEEKLTAASFASDCEEAWAVFETIQMPLSWDEMLRLRKENGLEPPENTSAYDFQIYTNRNYEITVQDGNNNGDAFTFISLHKTTDNGDLDAQAIRDYDAKVQWKTDTNYGETLSPKELIDWVGREAVSECIMEGNTAEIELSTALDDIDYNYIFEKNKYVETEDLS